MKVNDATMPNPMELSRDDERLRVQLFEWIVSELINPATGTRVVDLGAGHCIFSKKLRDKGLDVTAVDIRTVRKPTDEELHGIRFIEQDIREVELDGYDIVFNLGLFYHLTLEDQINLLAKTPKGSMTVVETQIYVSDEVNELASESLSDLQDVNGYQGALFKEGDNPMASWGNELSMWQTHESMLMSFEKAGYSDVTTVYPQFYSKYGPRAYYLCVH